MPTRAAVAALGAGLALLVVPPLSATWSIVAVDRATGQIGIAAASCTRNVNGIGAAVPGKGAIIVQAMSSNEARERGLALLREGATAEQILAAMRDPKFDPENQQYAVLLTSGPAATYSGRQTAEWRGALSDDGVSVQGNIVTGQDVLSAALAAYQKAAGKPLADRLLAALAAGADAGGDRRCGAQRATSAFVSVWNPTDEPFAPHLHVGIVAVEPGGQPAVALLAREFAEAGRAPAAKSRRVYVTPPGR